MRGSACSWASCQNCGGCSAPWEREDDDGLDPPESPTERAVHAALLAVADFYVELHRVKTVDDALKLHRLIEEVSASVEMVSRAALQRADLLCGKD